MNGPISPGDLELGPLEYVKAVLNILEDFAEEKVRLQDSQKAVLNVLEDFGAEKIRLEQTQRALLNILEDLGIEKSRLQETQQEVLRSEQAVRASLREKEVLLKEIHHRVKNNLQVISSLLNLQARYLPDPAASEIFSECQNRVQSIMLVHEKLYQSADLSHINLSEYVAAVVDNLFHTYNASGRGLASDLAVGEVRLTVDLAIPCGLIINELVTNSLKHAFPPGRPGTVRVSLREPEDRRFEMVVADDGIGFPCDLDLCRTHSLGLDLVWTFAAQIDADVEIVRNGGAAFWFKFPRVVGAS